jgi:ABC-2 type transport system ATP-binding protein
VFAIETRRLCKDYGAIRAVCDLSLTVPAGTLFGFLGPNGAGKTTTLRMLLGLLRPSAGNASVFGLDVRRHHVRIRRRVGYLPGDLRLYDGLTGRRTLEFLAAARGVDCSAEIARLAGRFDLDIARRVRGYSKGMKQKLGLIQALMHRPELLILDEPTSSLDPLVQQVLYDELRGAATRGATVLFSSHVLAEVASVCQHVAIVRGGRLVAQDRIEALRARAARRVEIELPDPHWTKPPPGLRVLDREAGRLVATWSGEPGPLLAWLASMPVGDLSIGPPDLEHLFLSFYDSATAPEEAT